LPKKQEDIDTMDTMKALVKKLPEKGIWMECVPVPVPGDGDVLIRIKKTSICGTDVHIYQWDDWARRTIKTPMVIGHEFVGEVVKVGSRVTDFKIGDKVSGEGHIVCGKCKQCLTGVQHLCPYTKGIGVNMDGAFAEYLVMPATNVWRCAPDIAEELYCVFDPYGNAVHSALSFPVAGEDVLVVGHGPIGIMSAAVCMHAGARNVVLTGRSVYRSELAKKLGIKHMINTSETPLKEALKDIGIDGFAVGLEMSGSEAGLNDLISNMQNGGKIALLGVLSDGAAIDWDRVVFGMLTLKGIYGREMYDTWYKMTAFIQSGLDISPIITHRFGVDDYQEAFETMASGKSGKIILDWGK